MGEVAERLADRVLVTSDNPRSEAPAQIIRDIVAGMKNQPEIAVDRNESIHRAIHEAGQLDVILLAGKGHESYQEIAGVRTPFSDIEQAQAALALRQPKKQEVAA
jgi:UDP-N-acetylmuramoyl-L-alanyl-D-glutamate--2,6-diaminopimelate ligase